MKIEYAVVDLETTGLFPSRHDRIVEIAIVRLNAEGQCVDEYTTLVNPERDVGPSSIHGIRARDVQSAPPFRTVVGDIVQRLRGTAIVAHNAPFDMRFLHADFRRAGFQLPVESAVCTMQLSRLVDSDIPGRSLERLCEHYGIPLLHAHSAYADAKATAALLLRCLSHMGGSHVNVLSHFGIELKNIVETQWPQISPSGRCCGRPHESICVPEEPTFLTKLVCRLPHASGATPQVDAYFATLDRALGDYRLNDDEVESLVALAIELGMGQEEVLRAHLTYFTHLVGVALQDGVLSKAELDQLRRVQRQLCVSEAEASAIIDAVRNKSTGSGECQPLGACSLLAGKTVCFTGTFAATVHGEPIAREAVEAIAEVYGLVVKRSVSKRLDIVVAADQQTLSTKARKAREYGIPVMSEAEFWSWCGGFDNAIKRVHAADSAGTTDD